MINLQLIGGAVALATAAIFVFTACKTTEKGTSYEKGEKIIEISKSGCFGRCPVYTMTVYGKGLVEYEGQRFTDKMGIYTKQLPEAEYTTLFKAFKDANLWELQDEYNSLIPDLPMISISYFNKGSQKKIMGKEGRPEVLMNLEKQLDAIVAAEGWNLKQAPDYGLEDNVIPNEIIVQLKDKVDIEVWKGKFVRGMMQTEVVKRITPNMNYWLIRYDVSAMPPKDFLAMVKRDDDVVDAEFNKKITTRN